MPFNHIVQLLKAFLVSENCQHQDPSQEGMWDLQTSQQLLSNRNIHLISQG
jgi:hypothetical protein